MAVTINRKQTITNQSLQEKTNYLAEDVLRDKTVSAFKVLKTPSLFLLILG